MEETLGKRISANRKALGLTQDQLAEQLGVTAQAVSKWENDQSCPDISTLPKLAEIFGITTDELLGAKPPKKTCTAQPMPDIPQQMEFRGNPGKRGLMGLAVWMILAGIFLFLDRQRYGGLYQGTLIWASALTAFGLMGLWPRFSLFRLGCALVGGFFLMNCFFMVFPMSWQVLLVALGVLLLLKALFGKKQTVSIGTSITGNIPNRGACEMEGNHFTVRTSFGEQHHVIDLARLCEGTAEVTFGELHVDLTKCGEIPEGCHIRVSTSFGSMELLVPASCRVVPRVSNSFGEFQLIGESRPDAAGTVYVEGSVSFGEMAVRYI